jgi:hypothetical protein
MMFAPDATSPACRVIIGSGTAGSNGPSQTAFKEKTMRFAFKLALHVVAPLVLFVLPAAAQAFERAPVFNAAQLSGIRRVGANYTIKNPVRSDGLLRVYVLETPYGEFKVQGDEMLRMRINELNALAEMEKVTSSERFARALAEAGISPLKFAGQLIVNPIGTIGNTLNGVGAFFGRVSSGMANAGQTPDDAVSDLLGVTDERRHIAATYGVDPYTDFSPLAAKLEQLSQAAAAGGLVVSGALMAIPGGVATLVVSNLSTANMLNDIGIEELARKYTAAQILDINRAALAAMGVRPELSAKLLANRNYTPIDMAIMVAALESMHRVQDRSVFVARAAAANGRGIAYVMRRMAEYMADDNRRSGGYIRFVSLANFPYVLTRDNRVTAVMPIDALSWTRETAVGFTEVSKDRRRFAPRTRGQMRITGMATALAKKELKARGWAVLEYQHR